MSEQGGQDPNTTPPPGGQPLPPQGGQWGQQPPPPQGGQWGQQHPPPQGGQWGQQPPPPQGGQWGQQPPSGGTSQLDPKIAGVLAYVPFGWIGGLVVYLVNSDPLSRFQGAQSVLLSITTIVAFFGVGLLTALSRGFFLFGLLLPLLWLASVGLSIYLAVEGYNLRKVTLPVIGPIAEQWAAKR